ncbi:MULTISPECIES: siderophore-interacting protein [Bosea]|uniref:siderophore-interacting protein n=1 Tax=Bosea TaxID=85413 RepID=UPI00214F8179|nr:MULTISPECIES: siderophore-interacting protein [Bosea]MCR4522669.1 siderophore-interacting protein [Bosea sp. 47.2.35]MDR6827176.1 NADPH-dependent ferric siderophore reductase [Bosea robiniae]MDR6893886.1 NADPH-dependent ferric siderophore reductase [Bosea sp. BE109]MDR7136414.1 NADPH-dependent ferric siderophore reductase [Bosea sp. BE168]MDR7173113.1 NADPH-dependent ferric siderophore reductase [Bosea sp. BE271]
MTSFGITHNPGRGTFRRLQVLRAWRVTPNMRRIVLTGPELAGFAFYRQGLGPYVKLLVPPANFKDPGWPRFDATGAIEGATDQRPVVRTYTVRDFDEALQELTIDFVLHGDRGPASRWAILAEPGDSIALLERGFSQPHGVDRYIFIGDHTALPAIAQSLESLPDDSKGQAIIYLHDAADKQPLCVPPGMSLTWLIDERPVGFAAVMQALLRPLNVTDERLFLWVGAEAGLARSLLAHAKNELGLPRDQHSILNYWRQGFAEGAFERGS